MVAAALRVGMIGVNVEGGGWAYEGHVPAVQAVSGLELYAVASRKLESAERTAAAIGAKKAYGDPQRLIDDPDVDVVAVVSPVPTHRQWILAAFAAGKHVLTEWPVAPGTADVDELAAAAAAAEVKTAVDLQARMSAAAARATEEIRSGRIGRVLGTTVMSSTGAFGSEVPDAAAPLERAETGMNLRTIQTAHTIDFVDRVLGAVASLQATGAIQYPVVHLTDSAGTITRTLPDRILVQGVLRDGSTLSLQVVGGRPARDAPFVMDVTGTDGTLTLTGGGPRGFQAAKIELRIDGEAVTLDDDAPDDFSDAAANVRHVYAALRDDIRTGSTSAPGFSHAAELAHLIDDLGRAMVTGKRFEPGAR